MIRSLFLSFIFFLCTVTLLAQEANWWLNEPYRLDRQGNYEWFGLVNHSGQLGNAFHQLQAREGGGACQPPGLRQVGSIQKSKGGKCDDEA